MSVRGRRDRSNIAGGTLSLVELGSVMIYDLIHDVDPSFFDKVINEHACNLYYVQTMRTKSTYQLGFNWWMIEN